MSKCIATRALSYAIRGTSERLPVIFRVFAPFELRDGMVDFPFSEGAAGCAWKIDGLPEEVSDICFGADLLQALQLAADIDGHLRMFRKKYEFYFPEGESYSQD